MDSFKIFLQEKIKKKRRKMPQKQKENCEFFVTAKKYARKQYVNSFSVITKMLEKNEKFGYSIKRSRVAKLNKEKKYAFY